LPATFGIESIIYDELAIEDLVIGQAKRAEAMSDPAQALTCHMGIAGVGVGSPNDFR
jgi:hypothetical protein